jgi:hypothetical protein
MYLEAHLWDRQALPDERKLLCRHTDNFLRLVMHGIAANAANRAALPQHKN